MGDFSREVGHYGNVSELTLEYREVAVQMVIATGRPIAVLARELDINDGTLGNWVTQYHAVSD